MILPSLKCFDMASPSVNFSQIRTVKGNVVKCMEQVLRSHDLSEYKSFDMANSSVIASHNLTASCTLVDQNLFNLGCLGPSLAIILVLAFLKRRESFKLSSCNGYLGLVIPVNFLRSFKSNRSAIAATFGATASSCLELILDASQLFPKQSSPSLKVIQGLASVLMYGIVFYPFFACLTTKYKLIGSLMGFVYAAIRLSWMSIVATSYLQYLIPVQLLFPFAFVFFFQCGYYYKDDPKKLLVLAELPRLCCLLFILVRFAVLLGIQVRKQWFSDSSGGTCLQRMTASEPDADSLLNGNTEIEHVRGLLNLDQNKAASDVKGFKKLLYCIYQPRPDFTFSTQFVSTLVVAGIILFEIAVEYFIISNRLKEITVPSFCGSIPDPNSCKELLNKILGLVNVAWVLCLLISIISLLHFMKCHRDHVFQLYRGERKFYHDVFFSPRALVGESLHFSGCQIAHIISGFFCLLIPLIVMCVVAALVTVFYDTRVVQQLLKHLGQLALGVLPTVVLSFVLWLLQLFLSSFVFCDRDFPNITITVDNRQLFSIASYFFFFYNIILGLLSRLLRILKAMLLGVLFMSRIDRTCLMQEYQTWDEAFVAYLGFLNVLVAHSHPVMLVFCHLLINRNNDRGLEESVPHIESSIATREESFSEERTGLRQSARAASSYNAFAHHRRLARFSQKAANRWMLAVMLLRNPSLLRYRRQGSVTRFVERRVQGSALF